MEPSTLRRRTFLAVATACSIAGVGAGQTSDDEGVTRETFSVLEGTDRETPVYVTTAATDGPTVLVVGGIHGNETAGYAAANAIAEWSIDAGTLVTVPEANAVAIERGTRVDDEGVDLNRQFPTGRAPQTDLARAIWDVVSSYDPDVVVDLHESVGIYGDGPIDGVGQAIFHTDDSTDDALDAVDYVNRTIDDPSMRFRLGPFSAPSVEPNGLLVHKAARELGADAFLAETLSTDVPFETRVQWHATIVERLADGLFTESDPDDVETTEPDDGGEDGDDESDAGEGEDAESDADAGDERGDEGESDESGPVARIRTRPADAGERSLSTGETVRLDASCSCARGGEIVEYAWDIDGDGAFESYDETIAVTVSAEGAFPATLRVTTADGATDTTDLVLSTD